MNWSPRVPQLETGLATSAAITARTNGDSDSPSTSPRVSRSHARRCTAPSSPGPAKRNSGTPIATASGEWSGAGNSSGAGTDQTGALHTSPGGSAARRTSRAEARATSRPSHVSEISLARTRPPARTTVDATVTSAIGAARNMSTVSRITP